jgi:hypothetical protein
MSVFELGTLLKLPRGTPDVPPLVFELSEIEAVEKRQHEITFANKETVPELMHIFNKAYCAVSRMMAQVSYEYTQAKKWADKRKGVVLLDVAPGIISKKGLKSSDDLRKAVLDQDEEYLALVDKVNMLEAAHQYLRSKSKGFEMSYQSAKKILDQSNNGLGNTHNMYSLGVEESNEDKPLIGRPKYG